MCSHIITGYQIKLELYSLLIDWGIAFMFSLFFKCFHCEIFGWNAPEFRLKCQCDGVSTCKQSKLEQLAWGEKGRKKVFVTVPQSCLGWWWELRWRQHRAQTQLSWESLVPDEREREITDYWYCVKAAEYMCTLSLCCCSRFNDVMTPAVIKCHLVSLLLWFLWKWPFCF